MENETIIMAYSIYLPLAIGLTIYVARILFKNGKAFMHEIFSENETIANSTSKLMEVGFYLLNVGFALLILRIHDYNGSFDTTQELIETLSLKIGGFSIYLGVMLFLNLLLFFRGRKRANRNRRLMQQVKKGKPSLAV
jgi:hypothetical protein